MVQADPDRLQQVLHNLMGNAIRHTPAGGLVELGADVVSDDAIRFRAPNLHETFAYRRLVASLPGLFLVGVGGIIFNHNSANARRSS